MFNGRFAGRGSVLDVWLIIGLFIDVVCISFTYIFNVEYVTFNVLLGLDMFLLLLNGEYLRFIMGVVTSTHGGLCIEQIFF